MSSTSKKNTEAENQTNKSIEPLLCNRNISLLIEMNLSSPLRAAFALIALNLVLEQVRTLLHHVLYFTLTFPYSSVLFSMQFSIQSYRARSNFFAAAEDGRKLNVLSKTLERTSHTKGGERRITEPIEIVDRELAKKSKNNRAGSNRNGAKKRGANQTKKRRKPNKKRTVVKRGRKNNNKKKTTRASTFKRTRYASGGSSTSIKDKSKPNKKPSGGGKPNKKPGKKDKKSDKKKDKGNKPSAYYPDFDMMACVSNGMPPPYFSPMHFSSTVQECCAIHFTGVVAECIMKSTGGTDGGYILAINHQTNGKAGKSSGGSWMGSTGAKSGKGGKSAGSSWMGPVPLDMGWGGAMMILQTEEPTYFPSYMPTTSMPTTVSYRCDSS